MNFLGKSKRKLSK